MRIRYSNLFLKTFKSLFESYWNQKWSQNLVEYTLKRGSRREIVPVLKETVNDPVLFSIFLQLDQGLGITKNHSDEEKIYQIESFVKKHVQYRSDKNVWNQMEYWQTPSETWEKKTGDCEDGALLMFALAHAAGIPAYRIKLCTGWVKLGKEKNLVGHAYIIFLRNDMTWTVCDWCYWQTKTKIADRREHRYNPNYAEIWWTANHEHSWAQKKVNLDFEGFEFR